MFNVRRVNLRKLNGRFCCAKPIVFLFLLGDDSTSLSSSADIEHGDLSLDPAKDIYETEAIYEEIPDPAASAAAQNQKVIDSFVGLFEEKHSITKAKLYSRTAIMRCKFRASTITTLLIHSLINIPITVM